MRTLVVCWTLAALGLALGCVTPMEERPISVVEGDARAALEAGEWERAEALDSEIIDRTGGWYRAYLRRGVARARMGDTGGARGDLAAALEERPDAAMPRLYRAELNLIGGNVAAAAEDVNGLLRRGAASLDPHERIILLYLSGSIAEARGETQAALRSYRMAIEAGESDPDASVRNHYRDALHAAAGIQYDLGRFGASLRHMERYLASVRQAGQPVAEDDWYAAGVTAYLAADFDKAREFMAEVSPARRRQAAEALDDPGFFRAVASGQRSGSGR